MQKPMKLIDLSDRRKHESDEEAATVRQRFDRRITIFRRKSGERLGFG